MTPGDNNKDTAFQPPPLGGADRRYLPRWEVNNRVLCRAAHAVQPLECRSVDLSCSGIGLITRSPLPATERLKLTLHLSETKIVEIEGRIVWQKSSEYGHLSGVAFENMALEVQDMILKYAFEIKRNDLVNHWFEGWNGDRPA